MFPPSATPQGSVRSGGMVNKIGALPVCERSCNTFIRLMRSYEKLEIARSNLQGTVLTSSSLLGRGPNQRRVGKPPKSVGFLPVIQTGDFSSSWNYE